MLDLNTILRLVEIGAAVTPKIIDAVRSGTEAVAATPDGPALTAADVEAHLAVADAKRAEIAAAAEARIEARHAGGEPTDG